MCLYAYPVIFLIFACKDACGIGGNRSGYAEAFVFWATEVSIVVKGLITPTYPK